MRKIVVRLLPALVIGLAVIAILLMMTAPGVLSMVIKEVPEGSLLGLDNQLHERLIKIAVVMVVVVAAASSVCFESLKTNTDKNEVS